MTLTLPPKEKWRNFDQLFCKQFSVIIRVKHTKTLVCKYVNRFLVISRSCEKEDGWGRVGKLTVWMSAWDPGKRLPNMAAPMCCRFDLFFFFIWPGKKIAQYGGSLVLPVWSFFYISFLFHSYLSDCHEKICSQQVECVFRRKINKFDVKGLSQFFCFDLGLTSLSTWKIAPRTLWHDIPPSHIILTLELTSSSSTFLMLSAKRKSS